MNKLRIILYTGELRDCKTDKETALSAYEDWREKTEALGIHIEDFNVKVKNALLLDEDSFIIDSMYDEYDLYEYEED